MNFIVNLLILLPARIASYFAWAGPLIMRLVVGYVFMLTGWGKLNNLPQMIQNFTDWGIPFPRILTPFVSGVECFGGVMLILTRRVGESLKIGEEVTVTVLGIKGNQIRVGIAAPKSVAVHREEIFERIKSEQVAPPVE